MDVNPLGHARYVFGASRPEDASLRVQWYGELGYADEINGTVALQPLVSKSHTWNVNPWSEMTDLEAILSIGQAQGPAY